MKVMPVIKTLNIVQNRKKQTSSSDSEEEEDEMSPEEQNNSFIKKIPDICEFLDREGEVTASRTLSMAVRGFDVSDCLRFPKFQIPGNAFQVSCSLLILSWRFSNLVLLFHRRDP
jgi:hypothetical protein